MIKKKYIYITNNKDIDLFLDKNKGLVLLKNNKSEERSNLLDLKKINSITFLHIKNRKESLFFKNYKDLFIIKWALKKKLTDNLRGYCLILNLIGLGFTMTIWKKDQIRFNIGYNHLIYYNIPKGILIRSKSRRNLFLFSYSYFFLKRIGTEIKNFRKLSVYKLKGIKEKNELYSKKNWKKGLY
jgi:hypothetical protein